MSGSIRSRLATRHDRRGRIAFDHLEARELRAGLAPTDAEQFMLQLVNRARANPAAEGQRLVALAQTDPVLKQATAGWNLNTFLQAISSYSPEPPLAFNPRLIDAAMAENATMAALNSQRHSPAGFLTNPSVATAGDGQVYYNTGSGGWATGENIFAFSRNVAANSDADYINYFEAGFLLDWGNPDFGHLKNILAPGPSAANPAAGVYPYSEVGIGLMTNVNPTAPPDSNPSLAGNTGLNVGPAIVTQEFGWRQGVSFLTGTFFQDDDRNNFYGFGEGLGGVTITATGLASQGTFRVQTWASGGYSLQLPAGSYTVTATGGKLTSPQSTTITIGADNVGWSVTQAAPAATTTPAPAAPTAPTTPPAATPPSIPTTTSPLADMPVPGDYDGIGRAEVATYRPSSGVWIIKNQVSGTSRYVTLGQPGDIPVPGKYDGGTTVEPAVYRPGNGHWFILGANGVREIAYGRPGDVPVPGDYDGDGTTDLAVYGTTDGNWIIRSAKSQATKIVPFGIPGLDQPVPGAYDGGGVTEVAVVRPTTFQWFIMGPKGARTFQFGMPGEVPFAAPFQAKGYDSPALYLPYTSTFFVYNTGTIKNFGAPGVDQAVAADYDGDGRADIAVFDTPTAGWYAAGSKGGGMAVQSGHGGLTTTVRSVVGGALAVPSRWASLAGLPAGARSHGVGPRTTTATTATATSGVVVPLPTDLDHSPRLAKTSRTTAARKPLRLVLPDQAG